MFEKRSKAEQARINGAKSRGPVTPEGKARSARNGMKHGAYANHAVLLDNEDRHSFQVQLDAYNLRFAPSDLFECRLVHELCTIDWVLVRTRVAEATLLNMEMERQAPELEALDPEFPEAFKIASALRHLTDNSRALGHTLRQAARLIRNRRETLNTFFRLRQNFPVPTRTEDLPPPQQLEPIVEPAHEPANRERQRAGGPATVKERSTAPANTG